MQRVLILGSSILGLGLSLSSDYPGGCLSSEVLHPDPHASDGLPGAQQEESVHHVHQHLPELSRLDLPEEGGGGWREGGREGGRGGGEGGMEGGEGGGEECCLMTLLLDGAGGNITLH